MPRSTYVANIDQADESDKSALSEKVADIPIADLEELSIRDISAMKNHVLRDLVNEAIQNRLAFHVGASILAPPSSKTSVPESSFG